jgi:hypothetical protein
MKGNDNFGIGTKPGLEAPAGYGKSPNLLDETSLISL